MLKSRRKKASSHKPLSQAPVSPPLQPDSSSAFACQLRETLLQRLGAASLPPNARLREMIADILDQTLLQADLVWPLAKRQKTIKLVLDQIRGLDVLQPFMDDPAITEIMVNGPYRVFIEKAGQITETDCHFRDAQHMTEVLLHLFSQADRPLNYWHPIADSRLSDGSRVNAILPPVAPDGPILTIRKFTGIRHDAAALCNSGFVPAAWLEFLESAIRQKRNIFISGGTGSGKTTLLNVLSAAIPSDQRIVTVEDSAELQLQQHRNLVRLECRSSGQDPNATTPMSELIRTALRLRPDRLIVGEVRGAEAFDLLTSLNTGHPGTLCTLHANSCQDILYRLANLILPVSRLPYDMILRELYASADYLVQIERLSDGHRQVTEIAAVCRQQPQRIEVLYTAAARKPVREDGES
ncbi:CpaF family protein [Oscillospiraceae bacterium HV4-5-C5C]|nr:CpaF family protein [Oscillospiraceae bacterium HV4-5-C5C]